MSESLGKSVIYFVRHGESIGNVERQNLPPDEDILSENGRLQANLLGKDLKDISFTHAFASPFARTFATAEEILSESSATSGSVKIEKDANIRERYLGIYEGKSIKEMMIALQASGVEHMEWTPEGGESRQDVEMRLEIFLQKVFTLVDATNEEQNILAVTHGGILVHLMHYLLRRTDKYLVKNWKPEFNKACRNTGYYQIAIEKSPGSEQPRELDILVGHGNKHLNSLKEDTMVRFLSNDRSLVGFNGCVHQ
ncbi:unnamed protein product [Allacma fusca]|uniref:Phosphoglycerate mutase-like protein n=1 Tax=Allacma fusca TaxID=39272 RepID=A0A8J2PAC2_9HEXA|nr:unnamed protein product [Allacma fusca]